MHDRGEMPVQSEIPLNIAGQDRYYDLQIFPLKSPRKRYAGQIIILRDITSWKLAEHKLSDTMVELKALQEKLYDQSVRDPLTDLYNQRFLAEIIQGEIGRAKRDAHPVSMIIMDLDRFKDINDTFGHQVGDLVLKHAAKILTGQSRASDYVFRYGGDEFLILLPSTHPQAAYQYAQRLRSHFERSCMDYTGEKITVTISSGVATFWPGEEAPEQALVNADSALYQAKAKGRNSVVLFTSDN
jgi:diguanylate cyclase (GGDEF)-like protein